MRLAPVIAFLVLPGAPLSAQEAPTAAEITEPGRTLARPLDSVLHGGSNDSEEGRQRWLVLLVDATPSLVTAGFASELEQALGRNAERLAQTRIGVARVGPKDPVILPPSTDHAMVVQKVRELLSTPRKDFQNVYAAVRAALASLSGKPGAREILLVTFENGDAEDDLEHTVARLLRSGVKLSAITREAYLADSYWVRHAYYRPPKNCTLQGADGPLIDLPHGWVFQRTSVNEITPSGYAVYGLSRLASASGGRVFLYSAKTAAEHRCSIYEGCNFCRGDHVAETEVYSAPRLRQLAPSTRSRKEALGRIAGDPCFRAVLRAWQRAFKAGIILSNPLVRFAGSTVKADRQRGDRRFFAADSVNFSRHAVRAEKALGTCGRILETLTRDLKRAEKHGPLPRQRAIGELTRVLLQLTKINLIGFSAWCREIAPGLAARNRPDPEPPEVPWYGGGLRPVGIWNTNLSLCHGVRPFFEVELPGGEPFRRELVVLEGMVNEFAERYANTPFVVALHRAGIARFYLTYPGGSGTTGRIRPGSKETEDPLTGRPDRRGGTSGSATGPTSGGGR